MKKKGCSLLLMEVIRFLHLVSDHEPCWDRDVSTLVCWFRSRPDFWREFPPVLRFTSLGSLGAPELGRCGSGDAPKLPEDRATAALPTRAHALLPATGAFTPYRARRQVRSGHWPAWVTPGWGFGVAEVIIESLRLGKTSKIIKANH